MVQYHVSRIGPYFIIIIITEIFRVAYLPRIWFSVAFPAVFVFLSVLLW